MVLLCLKEIDFLLKGRNSNMVGLDPQVQPVACQRAVLELVT